MSEDQSRRTFMKGAAAAAATAGPAILSALGANNKVNIGVIGAGGRGYYLMERAYRGAENLFQISAVCDAHGPRIARAQERVKSMGGNEAKGYADYRDILKDPSIDAVIIATPEHLHHSMAMDALRAGKHIYLEKPIAKTIEQGFEIVREAEKARRVVQIGTQNRSNELYKKAKEMVAQGMIGDCHYVRAFWYRNSLPDSPAWRYAIPDGANEQNTDWNRFLGPAPKRPFDKRRFYQWRLYWDYSGGISTDLLVHQTDITNFVLNKSLPSSCVASGGIYRWTDADDDREVPDTLSALYEYPNEKFHLNYSCYFGNVRYGYGEQFMGNEGTIEVLNRSILTYTPETFGPRTPPHIASRQAIRLEPPAGVDNRAVEAHIRNWLNAIQGKEQVIAPPSAGQIAAIPGHMATLSYKNNKKVYWDDKNQKWRFA
ncbi:MAG: Gfo/Idh/MocA family oxidoreductase [Bryobacteraceae bacterium]|nr:Gfo/Idh/MocA family oxidoreductase [Bryobacteraceae bacterium]